MTEEVENLVLELLRHIRRRVDQISEDVKRRLSTEKVGATLVKRKSIMAEEINARQQASIDRILERLDRIETSLELRTD
jgi:hypothetical protein